MRGASISNCAMVVALGLAVSMAWATEDEIVPIVRTDITARYHIVPLRDRDLCNEVPRCDFPTFEGLVKVRITLDGVTRQLKAITFTINGKRVATRELKPFIGRLGARVAGAYVTQSPGYLPAPFRQEIVGLSSPYLALRGITFESGSCRSGESELYFVYDLEGSQTEVREECIPPLASNNALDRSRGDKVPSPNNYSRVGQRGR